MIRHSLWKSVTIIGLAILYSISSFIPAFATPDSATLDFYDANNILYYDPSGGNECGTDSPGLAVGSDNEAKVWNWFATANIAGVSDNAAIIAGIMGNLRQENHFSIGDPSTKCYGIAQWCDGRRTQILSRIPGDASEDEILAIQLEFLTEEAQFQTFVNGISSVDHKTGTNGAMSYSDLFLVTFEGAYSKSPTSVVNNTSNLLIDSYAQQVGTSSGHSYWQEAEIRRNNAVELYQKYANSTPTTDDSIASDGSNVTILGDDNIVIATEEIKKLLPEVEINAADGRKFEDTSSLINTKLRETVVLALSSNDKNIERKDAQAIINSIGKGHNIVLVNNYSTKSDNYKQINLLFKLLAHNNVNVVVADWATAAEANASKYVKNKRPTEEGAVVLAKTIAESIESGAKKSANTIACSSSYNIYTGDNIPQYFQCGEDWSNLMYGSGGVHGASGTSICDSGCGPTSFAMMATALLGLEIRPDDTADWAGRAGMHIAGAGSSWEITRVLAEHYGLAYQVFDTDTASCKATIENALNDGWMIHTSGKGSAPFTSGGHYIGITGKNANGEWYIANSASRKNNNKYYSPDTVINAGINCNNLKGIKAK